MDVFQQEDYRRALKERQKELQKKRPSLTWRKLASEIPMQYTYLSKALNDAKTHLSEDHLFVLGRALDFFPDELDFLCLQRAHATSQDSERKKFLQGKIAEAKNCHKLLAEGQSLDPLKFDEQIRYLFEPLCLIVHSALGIDFYRQDPRRLCAPLTLTPAKLKEILRTLSRNDYLELAGDGITIREMKQGNIHFGSDHPLMRYHLSMVKSQIIARLARTPDEEKFSFLVTFNCGEADFQKIRDEFKTFLKTAEKIVRTAKSDNVYQLSFDLFKWL